MANFVRYAKVNTEIIPFSVESFEVIFNEVEVETGLL